jgi:hypothetical protein
MHTVATKLTIKVPEDVGRRAKARAALEGTTISAIVRKHLEEFAAGLDLIEEADDIRAIHEIEGRLARGTESVSDWDRVKADLDGLPD